MPSPAGNIDFAAVAPQINFLMTPLPPVSITALAALFALTSAAPVTATELGTVEEAADRPFMHHRVMFMHEPSTKAAVAWSTADALFDSHVVYWDTEPRHGDVGKYAFKTNGVHSHPYTLTPDDRGNKIPGNIGHHVLLEGLKPATTYFLVIVSGEHQSREFHFVTAPDDDRSFKLLFGGDSRRGPKWPAVHEERRRMNSLMAGLLEENPDIIALAHGADYCAKAEWTFISDWLSDHEMTTTKDGRLLPVIPSRGNHDRGITFEEIFYWPRRDHDFHFATDLTGGAVLLTLNTEISHAGDQRDWLASTLKRYRSGAPRWILTQYHIPAYGSVKEYAQGESQRQHWVPLFEEFQVDLVMEADHHSLKRTVPVYQDKENAAKGIVYIGDGGLGVPQRDPDTSRWYLQAPGVSGNGHHVHLLEISDEKIRGSAIGPGRQVLDEFEIRRR